MAHRALDDARLVALAQQGDRLAFDQLAERHSTRLRRVLFRIPQFSTWLTRIGVNEAYRGVRRMPEQPLELTDRVGERVPGWGARPDEVFESREFLAAVDRVLGELPLDYRTAVTLRDIEGLSTAGAAAVLGIGERALKSRVHRGRMALRGKLDDYFREGDA